MASKYKKYSNYEQVYSNNIWQDYVGAKWNDLNAVYYPDGRATYSYPLGKNSSSSYRPKSLFFAFNRTYSSTLDLNKAVFVVHMTKNNNNEYPSLDVYVGNSNAPYKKSPVCTVKKPYLVKASDSAGYVHIYYKLSNLELKNFKNLIGVLTWSRSKTVKKSLVKVGWVGINVYTSKQTNKISLSSSVPHQVTYGDTITWELTATQKGTGGTADYKINLPSNCEVVSSSVTGGTLSNNKWSVNLDEGKSSVLTYELKPYSVGYYDMSVTNYSDGTLYLEDYFAVTEYSPLNYGIYYTFYNDVYERSEGYFDIIIYNYASNNTQISHTVTAKMNEVNVLTNPLVKTAEVLSDSYNIGDGLQDGSGNINFTPNRVGEYYLHLRVPVWSWNDGLVKVQTGTEKGSFEILPLPINVLNIAPSYNKNKRSLVSVNVGSLEDWTILCESDKHNFLQINDESLSVSIEEPPAYIGCVELSRPHTDDGGASVSNSLINERYRNRVYMGKKGDFDEDIPMKIRMPPNDIATLEGLVEFDKPIPLDVIPTMKDGNPLNHRGWAELYKISAIKKINDMIYECEVGVKYLTHEINTEFQVSKGKQVYPSADNEEEYPIVHTYLSDVHNYTDKLKEVLSPSPYGFYYDAEVEGGYAGAYEIPSNNSLIFTSNVMKPYGNWNIKFRNTLPALYSEDYNDNWKMAIRLKDTESKQTLFEHLYHSFQHYDDSLEIVNKCKVTDTFWNGSSYETINYNDMYLNRDNFAPSIDSAKGTIIIKMNSTIESGGNVNITRGGSVNFNLTVENSTLKVSNKVVNITLYSGLGYKETFQKLTDLDGVVTINDYVEGVCDVRVEFLETEEFKEAQADFTITTSEPSTSSTSFTYTIPERIINPTDTLEVTLTSGSTNLTYEDIYYSFCSLTESQYTAPVKTTTNAQGKVNIPIKYNNGTQRLKLFYKGNASYSPCLVTELITIDIPKNNYAIEADDMEYLMYDNNKQFSGMVTYKDNAVSNQQVVVRIYKDDQITTLNTTTNENGVFTVDLSLSYGLWFIDLVVESSSSNASTSVTKSIKVVSNDLESSSFVYNAQYTLTKDAFPTNLFTVKLVDSTGNAIPYAEVSFTVKDAFIDTVQQITMKTSSTGYAYCPWYSETEDVTVDFSYDGGVQYESCTGSARILRASSTATDEGTWSFIKQQEYTVEGSTIIKSIEELTSLICSISNNDTKVNNINYLCVINDSIVSYGSTKKLTGLNYDGVVGEDISTVKKTMEGGVLLNECNKGSCDIKIYYKDSQNVVKGGVHHEVIDLSSCKKVIGGSASINGRSGDYTDKICYLLASGSTASGADLTGEVITLCMPTNTTTPMSAVIESDGYARFPVMREELQEDQGSIVVNNCFVYMPKFASREYLSNCAIGGKSSRTLSTPTTSVTGFANGAVQDITVTVNPTQIYGFDIEVIHTSSNTKYSLTFKPCDNGVNKIKLLTHKSGTWLINIKFNNVASTYGEAIYRTSVVGSTLTSVYNNSLPIDDDLVVVDPTDNIGQTFGSDMLIELRNGILNFVDYGMVVNSNITSGKIFVNNYDLKSQSLMLELEVFYDNTLQQRIYPLEGLLQLKVAENDQTSAEDASLYKNLVCSPSPVPDNRCRFTRHTADGTIYFFDSKVIDEDNNIEGVKYIGCPYNQYKGGCDLKTSNEISIFNLNNGYSPVYLDNGLVRIGFHRYSGYVEIYRYDDKNNDYCFINSFKIEDSPKLKLKDGGYSDDKITVCFGDTEWSIWRGKPYIELKHKDTDIEILNLNDRLICEKSINSDNKEFIEDIDTYMSKFSPFSSIQKFKKELHIGEDIREDSFSVEAMDTNYNVLDVEDSSELKLGKDNKFTNDFTIKLVKEDETNYTGVCFPSNGSYVAKPSNDFSLLVGNIFGNDLPIAVKCRGYASSNSVEELWSETKSVTPTYISTKDGVNNYEFICEWTNVPQNIQYIDFLVVFDDETTTEFNKIMLYSGTIDKEYSKDDSVDKASKSTIAFDKTCYAELFNDSKEYGLGVVRPHKTTLNMKYITKSPLTLLIPYMKQSQPCDKIENLIIEYINSYEQEVSIESIGGYI